MDADLHLLPFHCLTLILAITDSVTRSIHEMALDIPSREETEGVQA
jgi:hypothetical protein